MKRKIVLLFIVTTLGLSCSKDENKTESIVGTWHAIELRIDTNTASDDAKFGKQILDFLTAKDCVILTFKFNDDLTTVAESSGNYLEVNATATGLDVPCPTQKDTDSGTYTFDGSILTTIDKNGKTATAKVTINGDMMAVDAKDLNIPNFDDEGELIFKRN